MVELWFALLCFMLIVFVVLDGWDIGAGVLHLIVARTEAERREGACAVLYKTGDMVRLGPGGALQFIGRNDRQLKLRGLRIEPGEIEAVIMAFSGILECAVVAHQDAQVARL